MTAFSHTLIPGDDTLIHAAKQALTRPGDSSWSDGRLFVTHGLTFAMSRDSDLMDVSNFERIREDMAAAFPGDVEVVHASHWAFGWVDQLAVRVLRDPDDDVTADNITAAFMAATFIADALHAHYPLYDEDDYNKREFEATEAAFTEVWADLAEMWDTDTDGDAPDDDNDREAAWEAWRDAQDYAGPDASLTTDEMRNAIVVARNGAGNSDQGRLF